jgi:hypothetical protein
LTKPGARRVLAEPDQAPGHTLRIGTRRRERIREL